MDSDSQVGCLAKIFWSTLRRIKPPRPRSSSRARNSQATSIAEGRSEIVATSKSQVDSDEQKEGFLYLNPRDCNYLYSPLNEWLTSARPPSYSAAKEPFSAADDEVAATVEQTLDELNPKLRDLSLKIHGIYLPSVGSCMPITYYSH